MHLPHLMPLASPAEPRWRTRAIDLNLQSIQSSVPAESRAATHQRRPSPTTHVAGLGVEASPATGE